MYVPKRKGLLDKRTLIQNIILIAVMIAAVVISILVGSPLLKVLAILIITILVGVFGSGLIIRFLTGKGYVIANAINELLYIFVAIPILVISATYLPLAIYLTFFGTQWSQQLLDVIIGVTVILMVLSILYLIRNHLKDKKMSLLEYLKYLFDFERRIEEREKQKRRAEKIDHFYDNLDTINDIVDKRMEERSTGFHEFNWRERFHSDLSWKEENKTEKQELDDNNNDSNNDN